MRSKSISTSYFIPKGVIVEIKAAGIVPWKRLGSCSSKHHVHRIAHEIGFREQQTNASDHLSSWLLYNFFLQLLSVKQAFFCKTSKHQTKANRLVCCFYQLIKHIYRPLWNRCHLQKGSRSLGRFRWVCVDLLYKWLSRLKLSWDKKESLVSGNRFSAYHKLHNSLCCGSPVGPVTSFPSDGRMNPLCL